MTAVHLALFFACLRQVALSVGHLSQNGDVYLRLGRIYSEEEIWKIAESVLNKAITKGNMSRPEVAEQLLRIARSKGRERPALLNSGDFWLPGEFERALREREEQL